MTKIYEDSLTDVYEYGCGKIHYYKDGRKNPYVTYTINNDGQLDENEFPNLAAARLYIEGRDTSE
jgi:hypothetical protein